VRHNPTSFPLAAMPLSSLRPAVDLDLMPGDILVLLSDGIYEFQDARGDEFGERRVEEVLRANHHKPMAELSANLLDAVSAFAMGAAQEDDMTVVLVKREARVTAHRRFGRSFDSLQPIFAFTKEFYDQHGADPALRSAIDLTVEELFTNMVKYSPSGGAEIRIDLADIAGGVEGALTDYDVERFDVTRASGADVGLPIEQRKPGGLGLHLIRRLVDSMEYAYSEETRQARITFRKTLAGQARSAEESKNEGGDAGD
jgi:anti-sigma regulatory factor (Ser/Thr protein kinase)